MKECQRTKFQKKIDRPMGGIDANCVREGASSTLCTLVNARPLRNTLAPMTTRMLLRRGQHRSSHRNPRQHSSR